MGLTESQLAAVVARGNVLVEAGAGAGKTSTLIQRVLHWIQNDPAASIEQVMMVTFTNAAAAEMRDRLRKGLVELARANPLERRFQEQVALMDTAFVSTLHSFCLRLIRENFFELHLDPQLRALEENEAALLRMEVFRELMEGHYAGETEDAPAVKEFVAQQAKGKDANVRKLVFRMHQHAHTLPNPAAWFAAQRESWQQQDGAPWKEWLEESLAAWRSEWLEVIDGLENIPQLQRARIALNCFSGPICMANLRPCLEALLELEEEWFSSRGPRTGKRTDIRAHVKTLFDEATFLETLCPSENDPDPIAEDWQRVREQMLALLKLAEDFAQAYLAAKRELGAVDFADLEQFALRLLWDAQANAPTALAQTWRERIAMLLVDEYQDINAAQDAILKSIAREGLHSNRFLVGDVKQSIYRFRLANPEIFQGYSREWGSGAANSVLQRLTDNFRSHERILEFVNKIFGNLMHQELGGLEYTKHTELKFGAREERLELREAQPEVRNVEFLLHIDTKDTREERQDESDGETEDADAAEREAALIASRIRGLVESDPFLVYDKHLPPENRWRRARWSDVVILMRSPRTRAAAFVKQFERAGVPLEASRDGFLEAEEVADLRSLLQILDNPLQDIPLLAVLRSPFGGFTADELALVRCGEGKTFWNALEYFHAKAPTLQAKLASDEVKALVPLTAAKVSSFLSRHAAWRDTARHCSIYETLQRAVDDSHYELWLQTLPRARQRVANLREFFNMARDFDQRPQAGIYRFLRMLEAHQDAELDSDPAPAEAADAVRMMSIHASKGLEFPIVVLAGMGARFNFRDLHEQVLFHRERGLCPLIAQSGMSAYPSVAHWLARRAEKPEAIGEELRLLYVALTRAEQKLILCGTTRTKGALDNWMKAAAHVGDARQVAKGGCYLDWIVPLMPTLTGLQNWATALPGKSDLLEWNIHYSFEPPAAAEAKEPTTSAPEISAETLARLSWRYPYLPATKQPAKGSVSRLKERLLEIDGDAVVNLPRAFTRPTRGKTDGAAIGLAHHRFLQHADLEQLASDAAASAQAQLLVSSGALTTEEVQQLDFPALADFWNSELGANIRGRSESVQRELPFTARFEIDELRRRFQLQFGAMPSEFIVLQGVVDLAVVLPEEIWIVDFKTEQFDPAELRQRAAEHHLQLQLYAAALERIYAKRVSQLWIHFLSVRGTVGVPLPPA